ncbi:MAG TPA: protein kinase [Burkholderiales bacterium]
MSLALPQGFALAEYRIESTLGIGGFGITYLATDANLNLKVAIKEYLPGDVASREPDHSVRSRSPEAAEQFNWGRARFLEESRTLASFRHPNIVRVMRFFEANSTAYMVMEFVAGQPLGAWVKRQPPLTEAAVLALARPLLDGLEVVHAAGYLHRDIKPENIFVRADGSPVLLDFGSARAPAANRELTTIVSLGFAPFEQYHSRGGEGPWTDLYALGAVLYWLVTGERPIEAPARAFDDPLVPAVKVGDASRFSRQLLKAIDWALSPAKENRPQSVAELRRVLPSLPGERPAAAGGTIRLDEAAAPTVVVPPAPPSPTLDAGALERIAADLAEHIGPIARKVVSAQAKKSASLAGLAASIAAEIPGDAERSAFLRKHAPETRSAPRSAPPGAAAALDEKALARAESELAVYIGAVAKVLVKRAAGKARTEAELYQLLAEHIEDPAERKSFVRKAISISGRRS